jgi:RHH-type rel operon transcriptional repressor/antitoxin RelB
MDRDGIQPAIPSWPWIDLAKASGHNSADYKGSAMAANSTVTIQLNQEIRSRLEALARATNRSKSKLAAEAITSYVEIQLGHIAEIKAGIRDLDEGRFLTEEQADALFDRLAE